MEMISIDDKKKLFLEIADDIKALDENGNNKGYHLPFFYSDSTRQQHVVDYGLIDDTFWVKFHYPCRFPRLENLLFCHSEGTIYKNLKKENVEFYLIEKISMGTYDIRGSLRVIKTDTNFTCSRKWRALGEIHFDELENAGLSFINERNTHDEILIKFNSDSTDVIIENYNLIGDKPSEEIIEEKEKYKKIIEKSLDESISSAWTKGITVNRDPKNDYYYFSNYSEEDFAAIYDKNKNAFKNLGLHRVEIYPRKATYEVKCYIKNNISTEGIDIEFQIQKLRNLDVMWSGDVYKVGEKGRILLFRYPESILYYNVGFYSPLVTFEPVNYDLLANEIFDFIDDPFFMTFIMRFIKNANIDMNM